MLICTRRIPGLARFLMATPQIIFSSARWPSILEAFSPERDGSLLQAPSLISPRTRIWWLWTLTIHWRHVLRRRSARHFLMDPQRLRFNFVMRSWWIARG